MTNEPVAVAAALTAALTSTIGILLVFGVDPAIVGAVTAAVTAWVGFGAVLLRRKVTANKNVALTNADVAALEAANEVGH